MAFSEFFNGKAKYWISCAALSFISAGCVSMPPPTVGFKNDTKEDITRHLLSVAKTGQKVIHGYDPCKLLVSEIGVSKFSESTAAITGTTYGLTAGVSGSHEKAATASSAIFPLAYVAAMLQSQKDIDEKHRNCAIFSGQETILAVDFYLTNNKALYSDPDKEVKKATETQRFLEFVATNWYDGEKIRVAAAKIGKNTKNSDIGNTITSLIKFGKKPDPKEEKSCPYTREITKSNGDYIVEHLTCKN